MFPFFLYKFFFESPVKSIIPYINLQGFFLELILLRTCILCASLADIPVILPILI